MSDSSLFTISVVTPSYKQPQWLRLCAASVADQGAPGLAIEHIVQDSLSGPEVAEAVKPFSHLKLVSEKDAGMYDAINRGWKKATGDVLCWLNCDEQYLPGILKEVADYFRSHPEVEILFADAIIVDNDGKYLCSRRVLTPELYHTWTSHLQTFSCSTFFRGHLLKKRGFSLDSRWRDVGDADLIIRMLQAGVRMDVLPRYMSAFIDNGDNLSLQPHAQRERKALLKEAPLWVQALRPAWVLLHRLRRFWNGIYSPSPFSYDIYTQSSPQKRVHFDVPQPTFYWASRMKHKDSA
jgi:glycosyltransferase involved in cell wall biosynthesis